MALAEARTRTFARRKIFIVSTPTIAGVSTIEREYEASDQSRYFVPCPHCGHRQWLRFEQLRWERDENGNRPDTAAYVCESCEVPIAAINELKAAIAAVAVIDDLAPGSTTTTFSASKIVTLLDDLRAQILGGADAAYDTLLELQQALQNDQTGIAALTAAIDKRVRFDAPQTLTAPEQLQARTNIGAVASTDVGDTTTDFVAIFEAALIA